jgi:hypothetical protein
LSVISWKFWRRDPKPEVVEESGVEVLRVSSPDTLRMTIDMLRGAMQAESSRAEAQIFGKVLMSDLKVRPSKKTKNPARKIGVRGARRGKNRPEGSV